MDNNTRTMKMGLNHLLQDEHQKIIFGALKKLNIRPFTDEFDDFLQEARLAYAKAYIRFPEDPLAHDLKFHVYAYQAVHWRILDLINLNQRIRHIQTEDAIMVENEVLKPSPIPDWDGKLTTDSLYKRIFKVCTPAEQRVLTACYVEQLAGSEIAQKIGVSRQAISKMKKRIGLKALSIIEENQ